MMRALVASRKDPMKAEQDHSSLAALRAVEGADAADFCGGLNFQQVEQAANLLLRRLETPNEIRERHRHERELMVANIAITRFREECFA